MEIATVKSGIEEQEVLDMFILNNSIEAEEKAKYELDKVSTEINNIVQTVNLTTQSYLGNIYSAFTYHIYHVRKICYLN